MVLLGLVARESALKSAQEIAVQAARAQGARIRGELDRTSVALAAVAGILWALRYPRVEPFMGLFPGIKAFIAAVFGGIGSIPGAMVGGILLGFVEIMSVAFFPPLSGYTDAFAFMLLIAILLFRPTGLMGERLEEKI